MATTTYYYAEKEDATFTVNELNATDSSLSVDINHNGTVTKGYVTLDETGKITFTAGDMPTGTKSDAREMLKKHKFALYVDDGTSTETPNYIRIKKATEFTRSMNPTTEDYDYIADEHPTTEVTDYKPSESMTVKTIKGEADFELFYELYKNRSVGTDAHKDIISVFLFDSVSVESE